MNIGILISTVLFKYIRPSISSTLKSISILANVVASLIKGKLVTSNDREYF